MQGLGDRLKRARLRLAAEEGNTISPNQLGQRVSLTGQAIGRYEAGAREPDLGTIVRLAAALRVTPGWLAFGDAAMVVPEIAAPEPKSVAKSAPLSAYKKVSSADAAKKRHRDAS